MTTLDQSVSPHAAAMPGALRLAPMLYAATLFLSALLLFAVQPMFTKMVLPRLGGAPTVWSVAMVFFQACLLAGYAYAHLVIRRLPLGYGAFGHIAVLALAAAALPIAIAHGFETPPEHGIAIWLIALFALSIGLPFAVLSASAPLLQGWFAASGHPQAGNPYVLYAASNLGSFAALIAYPVAIEPWLTLRQQTEIWSAGYAVLAVLIALASLFVARAGRAFAQERAASPVSVRDRLTWMALSAIPAGLVIAVTAYVTTDIAAAPFLWVLPLALYLLTFVAVFRERAWIGHDLVAKAVPLLVAPLAIGLLGRDHVFWAAMAAVNLGAFVLLALLCHGELYRRRPAPAQLTEFYLWVSAGGVLGGVFAALVAPHVFTRVYEYPILIAAALFVLPGFFAGGWREFLKEAGPALAVAAAAILLQALSGLHLPAAAELPFQIVLVGLVAFMLVQRRRPARFFALVVLGIRADGAVAAGLQPGRDRARFLRRASGGGDRRRRPSAALSRHHHAWRAADRRRLAARAADLLLFRRTDRREHRGGAHRQRRGDARRGGRARHRQPRLPQARRGAVDVLRDRSGRGADRPRSALLYVLVGVRARRAGRARRCAADACRVEGTLRPDRARCVLLRRHPGASAHARGAGGLSVEADAGRRGGDAHLQPAHGAGARGGGGRGGRGARHLCARGRPARQQCRPTTR